MIGNMCPWHSADASQMFSENYMSQLPTVLLSGLLRKSVPQAGLHSSSRDSALRLREERRSGGS